MIARRSLGLGGLVLFVGLCGCSKPAILGGSPSAHEGRYAGFGVYSADETWRRLAAPPATNAKAASDKPAAATLRDDEVVLVTIDSHTGEVRQCGNVSGYCVAMTPWTHPPAQSAPATLRPAEQDEPQATPTTP